MKKIFKMLVMIFVALLLSYLSYIGKYEIITVTKDVVILYIIILFVVYGEIK